jgi:hypothetical protein
MQKPEDISNVELKFICNENWDKMHPVEGGRHCDVCNKKVVDFTNKTQNDFTRAWQEAEGKLCGRFKAKQTIHLPQFRFDRAAAIAATSTLLLATACNMDAQKTVGKIARPMGEPEPTQVEDSTKKLKPPVICNTPVKGQWETMVRMGDTIAPIEPPKDTIQDTSSRIIPPVPNINMLGGPKMIQPVEPQNEFLKGNIKEPVNIEVMGKPSPVKPIEPEPIGGTDAMNDFIDANIRWPEKLDHNLTVFVQVRIDKEGRVYNAYIIRGFRADVDSEAIRVARLIKFTPARNLLGDVTESVLTIPVNFTYRQQ